MNYDNAMTKFYFFNEENRRDCDDKTRRDTENVVDFVITTI